MKIGIAQGAKVSKATTAFLMTLHVCERDLIGVATSAKISTSPPSPVSNFKIFTFSFCQGCLFSILLFNALKNVFFFVINSTEE
jgi:hypothetical protein